MFNAPDVTYKVPYCMAFLICALRWAPSEDQKKDLWYLHVRPLQANAPVGLLYNRISRISGHAKRVSKINGHPSVRALLKHNA
ncbi:hypothetical protein LMG24238_06739 [Paraburkholderia sediminicola]|uniref:Uncharacterized protein n=1 Tax=Paraburkholderia sediminicola TaxID=458836 RepID=A0A6J5CPP4_9BURK|nr:hypothetical protein LMG24238_06739 [Paraburkholderia sediminicola]